MAQIRPTDRNCLHKAAPAGLPATARIAAFCASPGTPLDPVIGGLIAHGLHVTVFPLRQLPLEWFDRYATSFDLALIDADFLGDKVEMIDFGMRLRRFARDLPLVMLSTRIACSDHSTERMAFCDVTLRLPMTKDEVFASLSTALANHAYWRDGRSEPRYLAPRKRRAPAGSRGPSPD